MVNALSSGDVMLPLQPSGRKDADHAAVMGLIAPARARTGARQRLSNAVVRAAVRSIDPVTLIRASNRGWNCTDTW
jgi:hypothetical protein